MIEIFKTGTEWGFRVVGDKKEILMVSYKTWPRRSQAVSAAKRAKLVTASAGIIERLDESANAADA